MPNSVASLPDARSKWGGMAGNSFWLLSEKVIRWVVGLTVGVWMARLLGPHDFGLYNATLAWVALFASAAGFGIESIIVRELVRRPAERLALLTTAICLRCAGGILTACAALLVAIGWPAAAPQAGLVAIASLITLFSLSEAFDLWFQAHLQAKTASLARTVAFSGSSLTRVVLITHDASISSFLWLAAGEALLISSLLGILLLRRTRGQARKFSPKLAREILRESWPNIIANFAGMAYLRADRVMLASLAGESSAGLYSAAASLVEVWYVLPMAIMNSATPLLTRLHASDPLQFQQDFWRLARLHAIAAWGLVIVLASTAHWFVPRLFGSPYAQAGSVLALLAASMPFVFMGLIAVPWYLNKHLTAAAMRRHLYGAMLNLTLNYFFIPLWGAPGAATATVISLAAAHVFTNILDPKTRPIFHLQWRALCLLRLPPPL